MQITETLVGGDQERCSPPEAETLLAFGCSMEATNLPAFLYLKTQRFTDIQSLHDPRSFSPTFPLLFENNIFP